MRALAGFALPLLLLLGCGGDGESVWTGSYVYDAQVGETVGGSPIVIKMNLVILGDGSCRLAIDGFQFSETLLCRAEPRSQHVRICFVSHGDGRVQNRYGVEVYQPGEVLFEFAGTPAHFTTHWRALGPSESTDASARNFSRVRAPD